MKPVLLLGDEAVAHGAIDAGIGGAFSYPGTPSTEIFEAIRARAERDPSLGIFAEWSANEKVAYEEALGMSYAGRRALVTMKHVGLNVAMDPFINSALTGVNAGLVLGVADDPSMHSSQNEQDSRILADFAQVPVFEPANQREAYEMTIEAFDESERVGLPVMLRLVTRLCHSRAALEMPDDAAEKRAQRVNAPPRPRPDPNDWVLVPTNARRRFQRLLDLQPELVRDAEISPRNSLQLTGPRGIIATGLAYNYVREALGDRAGEFSILKIGRYPIPAALVRRLVHHCDEVFCIEEGYPFLERRLRGILGVHGKAIRGRLSGELPPCGELAPDIVASALGCEMLDALPPMLDLANRPPQLCKGCPHADSFRAIIEATAGYPDPHYFSDIGCYALALMPPFRAVHTCVDMGASIAMAHGASRTGAHPIICTIGDSTFAHSGMTPLIGAARHNADMTLFVMDNATVGMTGGQDSMACGERLVSVLRGLGVEESHLHVMDPRPQKHDENVRTIRAEIDHRGLSVIVPTRPCIHVTVSASRQPASACACPIVPQTAGA